MLNTDVTIVTLTIYIVQEATATYIIFNSRLTDYFCTYG